MQSRHAKNFLWILFGDAGGKFIGFVANIYLARTVGEAGFGSLSISLAILAYALLFVNGGIPLLGTQTVAKSESTPQFVGNLTALRILLSLIAIVVMNSLAYWFVTDPLLVTLLQIHSLYLLGIVLLFDWFYVGKSRMQLVGVGRFFAQLAYVLVILLFVSQPADVEYAAYAWVVSGIVNPLILGWFFLKKFKISFSNVNILALWRVWRSALPLGIANVLSQIAMQFPFIYLGWYFTKADAGHFSVAFRLMLALLMLDKIFYTVFFPVMSRKAKTDFVNLAPLVDSLNRIIMVTAITVGVFIFGAAPWIIPIVFGENYAPAIPIFQLLIGYFIASFANSVIGYTLVSIGKYRFYTASFFFAILVFGICIAIFPNLYGKEGVALALTIYQFTALFFTSYYLLKSINFRYLQTLILPIIIGLAVIAFSFLLPQFHSIILGSILACIVFPITLKVTQFGSDELNLIKRNLR